MLCGCKVSIIFTDLSNNLYTYSNTEDFAIGIAKKAERKYKNKCQFPFTFPDVRTPF